MNTAIKVLIVDDHSIVREGLKRIIELEENMEIIGEADDANSAIANISKKMPDIMIVDISLGESTGGIDLIKAVHDRFPSVRILVLSIHDESIFAERALRSGALGYITKNNSYDEIMKAVRTVMSGTLYLQSDASLRIVDKLVHGSTNSGGINIDQLSDRELEIFRLIGQGFGTGEIAHKLNIGVNTVQTHKRHIKEKMVFRNSNELVKSAVQWVHSMQQFS